MINIGAGSGSRSRSLELRSAAEMLGLPPCPERSWRRVCPPCPERRRVRLPACTELASARERALSDEGCGEPLVSSVPPCTRRAAPLRIGAISRLLFCQVTRHCVPSRFNANLLKTNDWHTCYPTLEKGVRPSL